MPAALTIAPLPGTVAVKTTSDPAVPAPSEGTDGFGQVLRSVWGGGGSAPRDAAQGQPTPAEPDSGAAAVEEAVAGHAASGGKVVTPHVAAPVAKSSHAGKDDHHAAADPVAATSDAGTETVAVATPVVAVATDPVPSGSVPVLANDDQVAPVRAAPVTIGQGGGGTPVRGAVPSRSAKASVSKEKASTETAPAATPAEPIQTPVNPVAAAAAVVIDVVHPAVPASPDGIVSNGVTPSVAASGTSGSGSQAGSASGDPNIPEQPVAGVGSDVPGPLAVPAPVPPRPPLPSAATESASTAGDHKVTLRPVEAGADPAKPAVPSGSVQQTVAMAAAPAATPATATPAVAVAAPHHTATASPVQQLAPALLTLAKTADGGQQMTVRLHPAELGMVQVRIAQAASGATQVDITADNPATLLALQRDQPQLHRALDDAGIAAAGRTVTFHVAQPAQAVAGVNAPASANGQGSGQQGSAGRTNTGATDADGSAGGGRGNYAARERTAYPAGRRAGTSSAVAGATVGASYRIGLDITA